MAPNGFSLASRLALANGTTIPRVHLGVYMMSGKEAYRSTQWALQIGYRAIDSAQMYGNEQDVGKAITNFIGDPSKNTTGLRREDIFYTSKLSSNTTYEAALESIRRSVKACGLDYIDLFLLHSPYGGKNLRLASWKAVQDAVKDGIVRIGGVSNFGVKHLEELIAAGDKPLVNQIEVHPFNTRTELTSFCRHNDIAIEAYAPLARGMRLSHATIMQISRKYSCTPAQLFIRWSLQHGYIPLPKSVQRTRLEENAQLGFFEIQERDMKQMDDLDEVLVTDWDPLDAD